MNAFLVIPWRASALCLALGLCGAAADAPARTVRYTFSGTTSTTMGGVLQGTAFTGSFAYDASATAPGGDVPYFGGTKTVYPGAYSELTLTIGAGTVAETVPGALALFNDVTPPNSIPVGDSFYSFDPLAGSPNRSTGSFAGLTPNFIYLGFVDHTGRVFPGPALPTTLDRGAFDAAFVGVNYGPFGTGNTTTISNLKTLTPAPPVPEPAAAWLMALGLGGLALAHRRAGARGRGQPGNPSRTAATASATSMPSTPADMMPPA